jgi:hypothetical protein
MLSNALMVSEVYLAPLLGGPIPFFVTGEAEGESGSKRKARTEQSFDAKKLEGYHWVECSMSEIIPADEQANMVLAGRARQPGADGRPLLSWETAVEKYKLCHSPTEERHRIDREAAWNDPEVQALTRAVNVAVVKKEKEEELRQLGIDPEQVLAEVRGQKPSAGMSPVSGAVSTPGMPPGMLPPEQSGQMPPGVQQMQAPTPGEQIPPEILAVLQAQGMLPGQGGM